MALFLTFFLCAVRAMEKVIPLSTQQRKSLVLVRKMVPDADNKFDYYVSKELVKYKDGVRQLVFVDEMPLTGWEHPCKYIYVDPENPTVESSIVVEAKYPPKGVSLLPAIKKNGIVEVMFSSPAEKETSVQVSACNGSVPATGCDVAEELTNCSVNAKAMKCGVYQLNLVESGKTTESR